MKQLLGKSYIMKLIWIFIIGSLMGYAVETGYYLIKHGVFLSKRGLLYGHFKPIYGFGSVLITLFLSFLINKSKLKIFIYGAFFGGIFEYICSLVLEYVFHTKMWNYSSKYFAINGRVYLLYLPMWGLIALFWLKVVLPYFNKLFDMLHQFTLKIITVLMTIFLVFDFTISIVAVQRMKDRAHNIPAKTAYQKFLDKHYSDEYILKRIPYLKVVN